jgi:hypothetical protein
MQTQLRAWYGPPTRDCRVTCPALSCCYHTSPARCEWLFRRFHDQHLLDEWNTKERRTSRCTLVEITRDEASTTITPEREFTNRAKSRFFDAGLRGAVSRVHNPELLRGLSLNLEDSL